MTKRNVHHAIAVVLFALLAVALTAAGVSAVNAQESDDAPPPVSAQQSDQGDNETSTPDIIGPPDSGDVTGQTHHYDSYEECIADPGNDDAYCRQVGYVSRQPFQTDPRVLRMSRSVRTA